MGDDKLEDEENSHRNEKCVNCKQILGEQFYVCDLCLSGVHKKCASLTPSEVKCMPLQKRTLALLCMGCRSSLGRSSEMMDILEALRAEVLSLRREVTDLREIVAGNGSDKGNKQGLKSYADTVRSDEFPVLVASAPALVIKPLKGQKVEKVRNELRDKVLPASLKIGIKGYKETKQGDIIVKCQTKQEVEVLKAAVEHNLGGEYLANVPKKRTPRMKIVGFTGEGGEKDIENNIRRQNKWINDDDMMKVVHIKKMKNRNTSNIYIECSPDLYHKAVKAQRVFIGWERYPIYEDLNLTRCYRCQGFNHKSANCDRRVSCGTCSGEHERSVCSSVSKKCVNCDFANNKFSTGYNVDHAATDPSCPSTLYHTKILRSRINYGEW